MNTQNMLRRNAEKTEVMLFISRFTETPNIEKLSFDSTVIELTERVRNLGFILDENLTMTYHTERDMQKSNQCNQVHRAHLQIERLSITFTSNGKHEFVPRDQVSPSIVVYCSLCLHIN